MKRSLRILLVVIGSLVYATSLIGQSIDHFVEEALQQNVELKALQQEYLSALEKRPQVSQLPDPELGVGLFPLPIETRLGPQRLRVSATQAFPWFGLLERKKELETAKAKAKFERIAARQLTIRYEIEQAWYQLYHIQENQKIIQRNVQLLEVLERLALAKIESGKGNATDAILLQLQMKELAQEIRILEKQKTNATVIINQLTNQSLDRPIAIKDSLTFAKMPFKKDTLFSNIYSHHPMMKMFQLQQEVSKKAIALSDLSGKPSFSLGLDYIMVDKREDVFLSGNGRDVLQLRAAVKIPIYRKKYRAKTQEEQSKIKALEHRKIDVTTKFLAEIENAFADYETAELKRQLYREQIILTKSAMNALQAKYSAQSEGFDELLHLQNELVDYDLKILRTIVESHWAVSKVRRFIF